MSDVCPISRIAVDNDQPLQIDECSEGTQSAIPPPYNFDDVLHVDPSPRAMSALVEKFDERTIVIDEDTDEAKIRNKDENELVALNDVKLNDDVDSDDNDETDEIEDISAYYKNAIIKLEGEVVEVYPQRNVSSSFVPIEADSLSIIDIPARNQKEIARIRSANEANASRAKSKANNSVSQLFNDISSNPSAVQSEVYESIMKFSRDTMRSIKNSRVRQP